jgi:hypothetical protein
MLTSDTLPATAGRVERNTTPEINRLIRARTDAELKRMERARPSELGEQLANLDREWDVERVLQTNASIIVLLGLALGTRVDRRFLLLPVAVYSFLAQHAVQGWCPPIPIFRRLRVRTVREIERERYALKAMRGDFDDLPAESSETEARVRAVLRAIDA